MGRKPPEAPQKKAPAEKATSKPRAAPKTKAPDSKPAQVDPKESAAQVEPKESAPLDPEAQEILEQLLDECLAEENLPDVTPQVGDVLTPATLGGSSCSVDAAEPLLTAAEGSGGCGALATPLATAQGDGCEGAARLLPADDGVIVRTGCGADAPLLQTAQGDGFDVAAPQPPAGDGGIHGEKLPVAEGPCDSRPRPRQFSAARPAPRRPAILWMPVSVSPGSSDSSQGATIVDMLLRPAPLQGTHGCDNAGSLAPKPPAAQGAVTGAEACDSEATATETAAASAAGRESQFGSPPASKSLFGAFARPPASKSLSGLPPASKSLSGAFGRSRPVVLDSSDSGEDVVSPGFSPAKRLRYTDGDDESAEDLAPQFEQRPPAVEDPLKLLAEDDMGDQKFDHLQVVILKLLSKLTIEQRIGVWNKLKGCLCREALYRPVVPQP